MKLFEKIACRGLLAIICGLFTACSTPPIDAVLKEPGVSRELARYRKKHFGQVRYSLDFNLPASKQEPVRGKADIVVPLTSKVPLIIDFRGTPEQILSLSLDNKIVPYKIENEHIIIPADRVLIGENRVNIEFIAADQSLNRRDEFMYTLLVPDRARTLFPCFDQPDLKSLFTLTLLVPDTWEAVANGAIQHIDSVSVPGKKRISFRQTEPLSTYLFSFVAGELSREIYTKENRTISIYYRETDPLKALQCPDIAAEVFDALAWMEDFTGVPYPFAKYDLIILPGFQFGGMEHTGATLYTDKRMFLNEHPTLNERLSRSALIAHETAHMWFGDYVTMEWFDDVWTKEVFANYFSSQIIQSFYPDVNHRLNFMLDYLPSSYAEDRTAGSNPIKQELKNLRDAGLVYGNIIYDKSPVIMEMLVKMMGKESFREGIREYMKTYAYGNATWEGLIRILDNYTEKDLASWSQVWVNEKGMPVLSASVRNGELTVTQQDPLKRGLHWPQELAYKVISGQQEELLSLFTGFGTDTVRTKLTIEPAAIAYVIPNTEGDGYGFFKLDEGDAETCIRVLDTTRNEVLRGSLLITLYENLLNRTLCPDRYMNALLNYLSKEKNPLLFTAILGYIKNCKLIYSSCPEEVERTLWEMVTTSSVPAFRLQAFRLYSAVADSPEAIDRLYAIWKKKNALKDCPLSEDDYISLSYSLAIHLPDRADEIVAIQKERLENPDRKRQYEFIAPSVSPRKVDRDSVFASLLIAGNRRIEPWAATALRNLNHRLRQEEAVEYIRPGLEVLQEIQRTGDIFFPRNWVSALLAGHTSEEARKEIEMFFANHPDYPKMLSNKIRQQADHLYRK